MSNSLAGVNLAQIAQQSLDALVPQLVPLSMIVTDFSADVGVTGESVTTRVATKQTSASLATGYAANAQTATTTAKTVTLGDVTGHVIGFTDGEWSKASINLQEVFIKPGINVIAKDMMDDVFALLATAGTYTQSYVKAIGAFGATSLDDIAEDLTDADVSPMDRFCIVKPSAFTVLVQDPAVKAAYSYGGSEVIRFRKIPALSGFAPVMEYTGIPSTGNLYGVAGNKQGAIIAARVPAVPQGFPGEIANVTDPDSGFTLQLRRWYSADDGQHYMSMAAMWGVAAGVTNNIVRIVSA